MVISGSLIGVWAYSDVENAPLSIEKNGPNMVERLRARLGDEGPTKLIIPEPLTATELDLEAIYPGHGAKTDRSVIDAMRAYLTDFTGAAKLANAAEAMQMMLKKYPDYKMPGFLEGSIQTHFPAVEKN